MKLNDKVAVVTGGARGIGLAIVERYLAEGAKVVVADIDRDAVDAAVAHLQQSSGDADRVLGVRLDVCDPASVAALIEETRRHLGGIDILVNNAAVFDMAPVLEVTEASYDKQFGVNVKGAFFTLQAVARAMVERGQGGKIINMASQAGRRGEPLVSMYCASKAAVISLTQSCGLALIEHGINVNGIARAWSIRRCGRKSMRSSPVTKGGPWVRRSAWSVKRCPTDAWAGRKITPALPSSWPVMTATTWWPRP